ncbi:MAG: prolipoprotein diacylglyceryl transferase [Clostridia bacterium]|nr:prolipoprotein diacylglyceryl transferase [Clostridia bacterium]
MITCFSISFLEATALLGISNIAFSIFGHPIYWYGIIIAAGVVLAALCAASREKVMRLPQDTTLDFALIALPVALVCARIYYVAFKWERYADHILSVFNIREGGLAIYGGVIGGALGGIIVARKKKLRYGTLADLIAPSLALGQAIGRWGNFFNQEAYGALITDSAWCFFPYGVYIEEISEWHMAAFFYESVWCFMIWLLLALCVRKGRFAGRKPGDVFLWYAVLYSAERCVVEGLRTDSLYWGSIRVSQALSAVMIVIVCMVFFLRSVKKARHVIAFMAASAAAVVMVLISFGVIDYRALLMALAGAVSLIALYILYRNTERSKVSWQ